MPPVGDSASPRPHRRLAARPLWIIALVLFAAKGFFIADRLFPTVFGDEALYTYKARNLAAFGSYFAPDSVDDVAHLYAPLFSAVLSPIFLFLDAPEVTFRTSLLVNAALTSFLVFPLAFLARRSGTSARAAYWIALVAALLPSASGYSFYVMSEALFALVFSIALYAYYRRFENGGRRFRALFWFCWSCLPLVRNVGVVLFPAYVAVIGLRFLRDRERSPARMREYGREFAALAVAFLPYAVWQLILASHGGSPQTVSRYLESGLLQMLTSSEEMTAAALWASLAQMSYLFLASVGTVDFLCWRPAPSSTSDQRHAFDQVLLLFLATAMFLIGASVAHLVTEYVRAGCERYAMYGRYVDPLVPVASALGLARVFQGDGGAVRPRRLAWAAIGASVVLFASAVPDRVGGIRIENMGVAGFEHPGELPLGRTTIALVPAVVLGAVLVGGPRTLPFVTSLVVGLGLYHLAHVHQRLEEYEARDRPLLAQMSEIASMDGARVLIHRGNVARQLRYRIRYYFSRSGARRLPSARSITQGLRRHGLVPPRGQGGVEGERPELLGRALRGDAESHPGVRSPRPTTLSWAVVGTAGVEIRVGSPGGSLLAKGDRRGVATTGDWVRDGMRFYLMSVEDGGGDLLAVLRVTLQNDHCRPG